MIYPAPSNFNFCSAQKLGIDRHDHRTRRHQDCTDSRRQQDSDRGQDTGRKRQREHVISGRPDEVLLHLPVALFAQSNQMSHVSRVVFHKYDIRKLHGHVSPRSDGDTDVRARQRWRVVDPIADHRHEFILFLEFNDLLILILQQHLYVSWGGFDHEAGVVVVDVNAYEVVSRIETEGASHINFGPDGTYAYLTNVGQDMITVIDADAMDILTTVSVGETPNEAVGSIDGAYVYTANVADNSVSVIETDQWEEVERIPAGEGTHGIDVSPDGQYVWTANRESNDVSIIDTDTREVTETIDISESINHLALTPDGSAAYVTAGRADEAIVLDSRTFDVTTRINVGEEPHEIAFTVST